MKCISDTLATLGHKLLVTSYLSSINVIRLLTNKYVLSSMFMSYPILSQFSNWKNTKSVSYVKLQVSRRKNYLVKNEIIKIAKKNRDIAARLHRIFLNIKLLLSHVVFLDKYQLD